MYRYTRSLVATMALFSGSQLVFAHHSATMFDHGRTLTITGRVVEWHWVNPHVSVLISGVVGDDTKPQEWLIELASPGKMRAVGWAREQMNTGDDVVVDFSPRREATIHGGAMKKLTLVSSGRFFVANLRE